MIWVGRFSDNKTTIIKNQMKNRYRLFCERIKNPTENFYQIKVLLNYFHLNGHVLGFLVRETSGINLIYRMCVRGVTACSRFRDSWVYEADIFPHAYDLRVIPTI